MANRGKTMDFYRPARATDPLVSRPKVVNPAAMVKKPNVKSTAMPPKMKTGSGVAPKNEFMRPMVQSSVTTSRITATTTTAVRKTAVSAIEPKTVSKVVSASDLAETDDFDDAWFDLEKEDFLDEKPKRGKVSYPFGGESPFLKSVKVEKRPLSGSVPKRNVYEGGEDYRQDPVRVQPKSKKKNSALSLVLIILITVILGAAAGVGVFLLIAN